MLLTVSVELPLLLIVMVRCAGDPTGTLPKARLPERPIMRVGVGVGVGVGDGVGVGAGVGVGVGVGVGGTAMVTDTSLEYGLCIVRSLYAVTAKKYVPPSARFGTVATVVFPTLICWV